MIQPFRLVPEYRDYVWGGERLRPGHAPTAEAWVVYENDLVADGKFAGWKLSDLAQELGETLLGRKAAARTGKRFPLLIKLLDCRQWLSLQVHPDDRQALALEGPGHFGKTEAWYVLEAAPQAQILCGFQAPLAADQLAPLVRQGKVLDCARRLDVQTGDVIFIAPGTLHALGPDLLIYEVQQTSDLTYRVWDWDRPASAGRKLHVEESLSVLNPAATGQVLHAPPVREAALQTMAACDYFQLDLVSGRNCRFELNTNLESFHVLTVVEGQAEVVSPDWRGTLRKWETLLVPAGCREFSIVTAGPTRLLRVSL